jgi:hypothetical protein
LSGRAIIDSMGPHGLLVAPAVVGLSLLVSACGASSSPRVSAQSAQQNAELAFSRCMRSRGVPNFPDPDAQGNFPPFSTGVSKQISAAADSACRHLLSGGGSTGTPQQRREKLVFALRVAECLRGHGFPTFPDPGGSSQGKPSGIDLNSPQFQTAETNCEKQEQKALGLP